MMPFIKGGSVNYGNGNALSIALLIFSNLPLSVLGRTSVGKEFKTKSEFHPNLENGPSVPNDAVCTTHPCWHMGFLGAVKVEQLFVQHRDTDGSAGSSCLGDEASSSSTANLYLPASQLCRSIRWHREEQNGEYFFAGSELQIGQFIAATRLLAAA